MKMRASVTGFSQIYAQLQHAGERVADSARKQMHRSADKIVQEAKLNTPVDKHNLEESIRKEVDYGYRGRLQIQIVVGGNVNGVNVDRYAAEVHENYDSLHPGPGTKAKMEANPGRVIGRQFLTRAVESQREKMEKAMLSAVVKEWHL